MYFSNETNMSTRSLLHLKFYAKLVELKVNKMVRLEAAAAAAASSRIFHSLCHTTHKWLLWMMWFSDQLVSYTSFPLSARLANRFRKDAKERHTHTHTVITCDNNTTTTSTTPSIQRCIEKGLPLTQRDTYSGSFTATANRYTRIDNDDSEKMCVWKSF